MKNLLQNKLLIVIALFPILLLANLFWWTRDNTPPPTPLIHAKAIELACQDAANLGHCLAENFAILAKNYELPVVWETLKNYQAMETSQNGCHLIAHKIAFEEVSKDPKNWLSLFSTVTPTDCTGGFLMGAMEAKKYYDDHFILDRERIQSTCSEIKAINNGQGEPTCYHIMGHLLLVEHHGNVEDSITMCTSFAEEFQYECYAGIFMENVYKINLTHHGVTPHYTWNMEEMEKQKSYCSSFEGKLSSACWREISHMFVTLDSANIANHCNEAKQEDSVSECLAHATAIQDLISHTKSTTPHSNH